jgi:hypothetical protein
MKRANILSSRRKKANSLSRDKSRQFYQRSEWKKLREKLKKQKRKQHEEIVMDIYKLNKENKPEDLSEFIKSDMPLCEINLKKSRVKVAKVLDHKMRIRSGGAKLNPSNLQWITEQEHAKKSGREAHE